MNRILTDRGVLTSAATGVVLAGAAVLFADRYVGAWIAAGVVWAATAVAAVVLAARRPVDA